MPVAYSYEGHRKAETGVSNSPACFGSDNPVQKRPAASSRFERQFLLLD
jgi:hypothetical protein